jgi:protein-S-isoprenylcysteine O-methyltransferase Ste14
MPNLVQVQLLRKAVLFGASLLIVAVMIVTHAVEDNMQRHLVERTGWLAIAFCILGRTWCGLYIAGRKNKAVVRIGPYSVIRNPLYLFSVLGAIGVGLSSGSIVSGAALGLVVFLVFHVVIRHEERHLKGALGPNYRRYLAEVPRWVPKLSHWKDAAVLEVSPRILTRIFLDALIFAVAIPFFEVLERLQVSGIIPILLRIP